MRQIVPQFGQLVSFHVKLLFVLLTFSNQLQSCSVLHCTCHSSLGTPVSHLTLWTTFQQCCLRVSCFPPCLLSGGATFRRRTCPGAMILRAIITATGSNPIHMYCHVPVVFHLDASHFPSGKDQVSHTQLPERLNTIELRSGPSSLFRSVEITCRWARTSRFLHLGPQL